MTEIRSSTTDSAYEQRRVPIASAQSGAAAGPSTFNEFFALIRQATKTGRPESATRPPNPRTTDERSSQRADETGQRADRQERTSYDRTRDARRDDSAEAAAAREDRDTDPTKGEHRDDTADAGASGENADQTKPDEADRQDAQQPRKEDDSEEGTAAVVEPPVAGQGARVSSNGDESAESQNQTETEGKSQAKSADEAQSTEQAASSDVARQAQSAGKDAGDTDTDSAEQGSASRDGASGDEKTGKAQRPDDQRSSSQANNEFTADSQDRENDGQDRKHSQGEDSAAARKGARRSRMRSDRSASDATTHQAPQLGGATSRPVEAGTTADQATAATESTLQSTSSARDGTSASNPASPPLHAGGQTSPRESAPVDASTRHTGIEPSRVQAAEANSPEPRAANQTAQAQVDRARFIRRVSQAFQAASDRGGTVRLRLHPPELGSLRLELQMKDGTMTARLEAEQPAARQLLLEHLPALRDRLAQQGLRVDRFDVDLMGQHSGDPSSGQQGEDPTGHSGRGRSPIIRGDATPPAEEEPQLAPPRTAATGDFDVIV